MGAAGALATTGAGVGADDEPADVESAARAMLHTASAATIDLIITIKPPLKECNWVNNNTTRGKTLGKFQGINIIKCREGSNRKNAMRSCDTQLPIIEKLSKRGAALFGYILRPSPD
jgi:hypothetical protein